MSTGLAPKDYAAALPRVKGIVSDGPDALVFSVDLGHDFATTTRPFAIASNAILAKVSAHQHDQIRRMLVEPRDDLTFTAILGHRTVKIECRDRTWTARQIVDHRALWHDEKRTFLWPIAQRRDQRIDDLASRIDVARECVQTVPSFTHRRDSRGERRLRATGQNNQSGNDESRTTDHHDPCPARP
jgi:hypothetical protein